MPEPYRGSRGSPRPGTPHEGIGIALEHDCVLHQWRRGCACILGMSARKPMRGKVLAPNVNLGQESRGEDPRFSRLDAAGWSCDARRPRTLWRFGGTTGVATEQRLSLCLRDPLLLAHQVVHARDGHHIEGRVGTLSVPGPRPRTRWASLSACRCVVHAGLPCTDAPVLLRPGAVWRFPSRLEVPTGRSFAGAPR